MDMFTLRFFEMHAANDPRTSEETLLHLAKNHHHWQLRRDVARNPSTPLIALEDLSKEEKILYVLQLQKILEPHLKFLKVFQMIGNCSFSLVSDVTPILQKRFY